MAAAAQGPRVLLRRLREIMAERIGTQDRLDRIVQTIAANLVAEVCSIYVRRAGGQLELFATEGLAREAVHRTQLGPGEGLVGMIAATAEPLRLMDAQSHPNFSYRPETGEDPYKAFLGVPILRHGDPVGVLTVQNRTRRDYGEEELEALETVAMVLAETMARGELIPLAELDGEEILRTDPVRARGLPLAEGIAIGQVVLHEPRVRLTRFIADDTADETARLEQALAALQARVDAMLSGAQMLEGESREVIETYRMLAHDRGWRKRLKDAVAAGLTAEAAVERVHNETRARMMRVEDPYLRERLHDFEDLANRLLRALAGADDHGRGALPDDAVILARTMGPAELLDYETGKLRGVVLAHGSDTSHVAIVAKALGIPLVGGLEAMVDAAEPGDMLIADGETGEVHLRPAPEVVENYRAKLVSQTARRAAYAQIKDLPAVTRDGEEISLRINAGLLIDLPQIEASGADGIGLFRTELQFMVSATMPGFSAQRDLYARVLSAAAGRHVTFRTLDLGGDKVLPYGRREHEENPALGWRAIRIGLDRPALLRYQLRALIAAAAGRELSVLFPMIAEVAEFAAARTFAEREVERARRRGLELPNAIRFGAMVEVPALGYQADALMAAADFVAVGSNDLMQFLFAADRANHRLAGRYDPMSPAALGFLRRLIEAARAAKTPISVCGEMAGRPLEAMALIGLGFRTLSMAPAAVGPVKAMVRAMSARELEAMLVTAIARPDHSLREMLLRYAGVAGVPIVP